MFFRIFQSMWFSLIGYQAITPFAVVLSISDRYGAWLHVVDGARAMIIVFCLTYFGATLYLVSSNRNQEKVSPLYPVIVLAVAYITGILILSIFRFHFSLSYLATFIVITLVWTSVLDVIRQKNIKPKHYALVAVGHWQGLLPLESHVHIVQTPEDLKDLNYDVLAVDHHIKLDDNWLNTIADHALENIPVCDLADLFEVEHGRVSLEHFSEEHLPSPVTSKFYRLVKRVLDIGLSALGLIIIALPTIFLMVVITLQSSGSPIYRQARVGKRGKVFLVYKLRTMHKNAEIGVPRFSKEGDPRITSLGKHLRRFRIDEWPQFINVLRGEMSLVGPRPERPQWVERYRQTIGYYNLRHVVRPGITGLAQVEQGYASDRTESLRKLEYDLYYIKNMDFDLDFKILVSTISVLFRGQGAK